MVKNVVCAKNHICEIKVYYSITCNYWTSSKKNHYIIVILSICDLRVMLEGHTQPEANYDCNLMSINGLYVRKLIMRFLNKNLFCSKGRWRPSWIFVIFDQTQNASFEIKTGDLHQSFLHLNALKNLVH